MPATLQAGDIPALFDRAGCTLRVQGTTTVVTTEALPGGEVLGPVRPLPVPARCVARRSVLEQVLGLGLLAVAVAVQRVR